jgi:hypothetical protein
MKGRVALFEQEVKPYLPTLKPAMLQFGYLHDRLSSCHPEDFEALRHRERTAARELVEICNRYQLRPKDTCLQLEAIVLDWYRSSLKGASGLKAKLKEQIDRPSQPVFLPFTGRCPKVPAEELVDGTGFWRLSDDGPGCPVGIAKGMG